jgi:hypothetical protein
VRVLRTAALLAVITVALGVPLAVFAGGGAKLAQPSFAFGRTGGNIIPFTVRIGADGRLSTTGSVHLADPAAVVSLSARNGLVKLVGAEGFWKLPALVRCPGVLPDVAAELVTVTARGTTRTVTIHGACNRPFNELYAVLLAVVGAR